MANPEIDNYCQEVGGTNVGGLNGYSSTRVEIVSPLDSSKPLLMRVVGLGGAPSRSVVLPDSASERKAFPVASGLMDYFPDALAVIANVSYQGNEQHNPGKPINWDRAKSGDEADTMLRHFLQRGSLDTDGIRHTAKMAWRALALLQKELEEELL